MQLFINQAISQRKDTLGLKLSEKVLEFAARKSIDITTDVGRLCDTLGNLFCLAKKGSCQVYVFVDYIDATAESDRENDLDEFVRMLKETAQCGRDITRTKRQQLINVLVTSCRLCEENILSQKRYPYPPNLFGWIKIPV